MAVDAKALTRALDQHITARCTSARCWMVSSSTGRGGYEVIVDGDLVVCRCPAGLHNRPCKHGALVQILDASGAVPIPERRSDPAKVALAAELLGGEG